MNGFQKVLKANELFPKQSIPNVYFIGVTLGLSSLFSSASVGQQESTSLIRPRPNPFRSANVSEGTEPNREHQASSDHGKIIGLERLSPNQEPPVITALSVDPNGELLAAAGDDHAIRIVDIETGKTKHKLLGHLDWVQCVEFSPDGKWLASCGNDGQLRLWKLSEEPTLEFQKPVGHALYSLCFVGSDCIYVAGFGSKIYRWTKTRSQLDVDHTCECRDIRSIVASPDLKSLAYAGRDGVLRVRHIVEPGIVESGIGSASDLSTAPRSTEHHHDLNEVMVPLHFGRIRSIQFSNDGSSITSVGEDRRIVHYSLTQRKTVDKTEIGGGKLMGLCQLEPHLFAIAGSDNSIRIFNDLDHVVVVKLIGHDGSVGVLRKSNRYLISGSYDTTIRIWNIDNAITNSDQQGKYVHPIAAQFEDSGAGDAIK